MPLGEILGGQTWLYNVIQGKDVSEAKPAQPCAFHRRDGVVERVEAGKLKSRKPTKRKGGWGTTTCIDHPSWRTTRSQLFEIGRAGFPPTIFATVRSPAGFTETAAKREIERIFSRLGEKLQDHGHEYIGLKVYEKERGGILHGHALIHVRPEQFRLVAQWADYFEPNIKRSRSTKYEEPDVPIHARRAVESDFNYILKQHRYAGPYEARRGGWTPSEPFKGQRISWTKAARAILGIVPARPTKEIDEQLEPFGLFRVLPEAPAPCREHVLPPRPRLKLTQPNQLELALDRQPDVIDLMARLGKTDAEIAAKIGRSRPQTTNIRNRQFGASRPVARRILELALAA